MPSNSKTSLKTIVDFARRKGFVFPSSEIYGGFAATYDFGPLGILLKKNIEHIWRSWNVTTRTDMVEIEGAIFMHPKIWEASGHIGGFSDLLVEDTVTHKRYRADHLVEDAKIVWPVNESKNSKLKNHEYNFLFLHGYEDDSSKHFWPSLKKELEQLGNKVFAPDLPNPTNPTEKEQFDFILNNYKIDQKTIIIGHSLGSVIALKIAEKVSNIGNMLLIDPFVEAEFNGYVVNFKDSFNWNFDWENIKNNVGKIVILADKSEKPVPVKNSEIIAKNLSAKLFIETPNENHFCSANEPEIMNSLRYIITEIQEYSLKTLTLGIKPDKVDNFRENVRVLLYNPKTNKYAIQYVEKYGSYSLLGGGIEKDHSQIDTARKELIEESGYTDFTVASQLGGKIDCFYEEDGKNCEFLSTGFVVILNSEENAGTKMEDYEIEAGCKCVWKSKEEVLNIFNHQVKTYFSYSYQLEILNRGLGYLESVNLPSDNSSDSNYNIQEYSSKYQDQAIRIMQEGWIDSSTVDLEEKTILENCARTSELSLQDDKYKKFIILEDETVIGYLGLEEKPNNESFISDFYVKRDARRKGVGSILFLHGLEYLKQKQIKHIDLYLDDSNVKAERFYSKFGFTKFKASQFEWLNSKGEVVATNPEHLMRLDLAPSKEVSPTNIITNAGSFSAEEIDQIIEHYKLKSPDGNSLSKAKKFNLLIPTHLGPVEDETSVAYLKGESCANIYVDWKAVQETTRRKLPFGIAQIGKAFRNEITVKQFMFRTREFEQMDVEFFVKPGTEDKFYAEWKQNRWEFYTETLKFNQANLQYRQHDKDELVFYAKEAWDVEYNFGEIGFKELEGIHNRTDYDTTQHSKFSGQDLTYFDAETNTRYNPYIVEMSAGFNRMYLAVMFEFYKEEILKTEKGQEETRIVFKLPYTLAPFKLAVLPLMKKDGLGEFAFQLYSKLRKQGISADYDEAGSIGKRYRRQDENGTPWCLCVDYETIKEGELQNTVTLRNRDTMQQSRVAITELENFIKNF